MQAGAVGVVQCIQWLLRTVPAMSSKQLVGGKSQPVLLPEVRPCAPPSQVLIMRSQSRYTHPTYNISPVVRLN
jgi:hypothetical protein